jgi:cutinase
MDPVRRRHRARYAVAAVAAVLTAAAGCVPGPGTIGTPCADVELVVARGTFESGPLGATAGDPLLAATRPALAPRTVTAHAVAYPADLAPTSPPAGNRAVVTHVINRASECPATQFVLVGYSQGAQVMDMALGVDMTDTGDGGPPVATIPAALEPRVAAIVLYGNPLNLLRRNLPPPYAGRTLDICAAGDPVCEPGGMNIAAHISYWADAYRAAAFIRDHTA